MRKPGLGTVLGTLLPALLVAHAAIAQVAAVTAVEIVVQDLERAAAFYRQVLDFVPDGSAPAGGRSAPRTLALRLGEERIRLLEYSLPGGRPIPADSRSNDRWFQHIAIIAADLAAAHARLVSHGVIGVSQGPQRLPDWNPDAGGIEAWYFLDPDRHVLEILAFPPGKGQARWQRRDGTLFLGIDHTAIVVADTGAALRFYRDALGLAVAGGSENHGIEQARLNNVPGAHLRITTLRAPAGPGVELLEYLAPGPGRPMPADSRLHDLWAWRTVLALRPGPASTQRIEAALAAGGAIVAPEPAGGSVLRDPDGHALSLTRP